MPKKKQDRRVALIRNSILSVAALIAASIVGYITYVGSGLDEGAITEGQDYFAIEDPRRSRPGDPIEVVEFFAYGCVHCKTFDPVIESWAENQPDDVAFRRAPTTFSPAYALLSQTYYALEEADLLEQHHARLFRAIHESGRQFLRPQDVAKWLDGRGISAEAFLRIFDSPAVRAKVRAAERDQRAYQISATPQMVVAGKYLVTMNGGQRRALDVLDYLIEKQRQADAAATN